MLSKVWPLRQLIELLETAIRKSRRYSSVKQRRSDVCKAFAGTPEPPDIFDGAATGRQRPIETLDGKKLSSVNRYGLIGIGLDLVQYKPEQLVREPLDRWWAVHSPAVQACRLFPPP